MEYPCGECRKEVGEDDKVIQCEAGCQCWYHGACVGITDNEYDYLSASEVAWNCRSCSDFPSFNSADAIDVFYFDSQKNLPTPKLPLDIPFQSLLCIHKDSDGLNVAWSTC